MQVPADQIVVFRYASPGAFIKDIKLFDSVENAFISAQTSTDKRYFSEVNYFIRLI